MQRDWQLPVTLISFTVGILLSTQFKSQADYRNSIPSRRVEDLMVMLKSAEQTKKSLEKEVLSLRTKLQDQGGGQHNFPTNWTAMKGPGLEVTIVDSPKSLQKGEDPNMAVAHNVDLLQIINELRSDGAEAIAINDQRLAENSEIACAGSTIMVNRSRIAPPFIIKAIGNQETMEAGLKMRGGIVDYLQFYGIQVTISKKAEVVVPMYRGANTLKYAHPVTQP